jgi:glycine cleavage system aminomethyltransferase T
MSRESEAGSIRRSVAFSENPGRVCLRLAGGSAESVLNRVCPCELFIRDGQMQHTLFLNERGNPLADVFVCADGDDFLLLADGMTAEALAAFVQAQAGAGEDLQIADLMADHVLCSVNGPYAWELLSEVISTEIIGLPFSAFFRGDDFICFRTSATGEYSYDLLIRRELAPAWRERIFKTGKAFDIGTVGAAALNLCALENFIFNIHTDAVGDVTPLELQLQWRISYRKSYPGSAALAARRKTYTRRAVLAAAASEMKIGHRLRIGDREVGSILNAGFSFERREWLALALVDREWAYSDVPAICVSGSGIGAPARILSAPAINNRSLFVDPQRHTYAGRGENAFPSLIHSPPQ